MEEDLPLPGSDVAPEKIFDYAFLHDKPTVNYLNGHGCVMFIIRGPPGTAKETLSDMILERYPSHKLLSAKDYFKQPLHACRANNGARLSHHWCFKKTVEACTTGTRVIVVRNTNIRKSEIGRYLHLCQDYSYTTIIADTSKKFNFDPEVLERSNTQGLTKKYFESRLAQWEEIVPWYTGWFLNPADSLWLQNCITKHLSALLQFPEFTNDFSFHSDADIDEYYKNNRELFCIAGFYACQQSEEHRYLNKRVQNEIGKVSELMLTGYVVTSEMVLAVVSLSSEQAEIAGEGKSKKSEENDPFVEMFQQFRIQSRREPESVQQNVTAPSSQETVVSCDSTGDQNFSGLSIKNLSYIVMKHNSTKSFPYITNVDAYSEKIFSEIKGKVLVSSNDFSFCQLKQAVWLVCPLNKHTMQSVFTGLYS